MILSTKGHYVARKWVSSFWTEPFQQQTHEKWRRGEGWGLRREAAGTHNVDRRPWGGVSKGGRIEIEARRGLGYIEQEGSENGTEGG